MIEKIYNHDLCGSMGLSSKAHRPGNRQVGKGISARAIGLGVFGMACGLVPSEANAFAGQGQRGGIANTGNLPVVKVQASGNFAISDMRGTAGQPLPVDIRMAGQPGTSYSFFMFRNMPKGFKLSAGFGTKTYWAVSFHDFGGLRMLPPAGYAGSFELEVLLVKTIGSDPERNVAQVTILPPGAPMTSEAENSSRILTSTEPQSKETIKSIQERLNQLPLQQNPPVARAMTAGDHAMMKRGDIFLEQGDVASARLIYRRLARKNIAEGALAMGKTFDPQYLGSLGVQGLLPDVDKARDWYQKAQALGSQQASQRLSSLGGS